MGEEYTPPDLGQKRMRIIEDAIHALRKHPESASMSLWVSHNSSVPKNPDGIDGYCGTTACLAGHIGLALGLPPRETIEVRKLSEYPRVRSLKLDKYFENPDNLENDFVHVSEIAARILKLEIFAPRVFNAYRWPYPFKRRYERAKTYAGRANAMIARLEYYLETGK